MRIFLACAFAAALVGVSACGGSGGGETTSDTTAQTPDEMAIATVIDKYEQATKDHDAKLLCNEVLSTDKDSPYGQDPKTCTLTIGKVMKDPTSELGKPLAIDVRSYSIKGKLAKVKANVNGEPKTLTFYDDDNGWHLAIFS